ncbi:hypothetical protein F4679DRAFT_567594 [Xylaria curta]|nr:hypothetical protein F4679DRAFT_567594 [Xylaria curta]
MAGSGIQFLLKMLEPSVLLWWIWCYSNLTVSPPWELRHCLPNVAVLTSSQGQLAHKSNAFTTHNFPVLASNYPVYEQHTPAYAASAAVMDPLTAVGLAAGVVQFVSFASHLISRTKEIHESASGQAKETLTIEKTYTTLQDFCWRLEASSQRHPQLEMLEGRTDFVKHIFAINDLSRTCESDCRKLLEIISKLKAIGGESHRRWQTFKVALKTVWKGNEIVELENRLQHTQMTLTLHVCFLANFWYESFDQHLKQLRSETTELKAQQSAELSNISKTLNELSARITSARSTVMQNVFGPDDIECIKGQMERLSVSKSFATRENVILRSLSFDSRPVRHTSIPDASKRTFEWAFQQSNLPTSLATGSLLKWLREGEDSFWVTGKPGSGKSTFMKYVAGNPKTLSALSCWSHPKRPVLASHYFWSAGTPPQKSQQGLLQTLLYDIFRQLPDLIETVCAERWHKTIEELQHEQWQVPELQRVLQRIAGYQDLSVKFCFFIDGLDEFDGDHVDFCQSLHALIQSPHIKLCVSSRPWNVFEKFFGHDDGKFKLYIHELTRNDIRAYAERRLQDHPRWKELEEETTDAGWIIDEITERAAGVFLWVFLVTKELRSGLNEYDSFSDLQRRLDSIPVDLEAFFKHILQSVEIFYHQKMATTLQLSLAARQPAPIEVYGFHDVGYIDENYALDLPLGAIEMHQVVSKRRQITCRLNARCRGLLEVNRSSQRVEFLHRTVMDFLRTREMSEFLASKAPLDFNPNLSLLRAYTAYIKTTEFPEFVDRTGFNQYTASGLMQAVHEALAQAGELQGDIAEVTYPLLDELDRSIPVMHKRGQATLNVWGDASNPVTLFFREPVIASDLAGYLSRTLPGRPDYFSGFERPPLLYILDSFRTQIRHKIDMVYCLLKNGHDPNAIYLDPICGSYRGIPWNSFMSQFQQYFAHGKTSKAKDGLDKTIMEELPALVFQHGVNTNIYEASLVKPGHSGESQILADVLKKRSIAMATSGEQCNRPTKRFKEEEESRDASNPQVWAG